MISFYEGRDLDIENSKGPLSYVLDRGPFYQNPFFADHSKTKCKGKATGTVKGKTDSLTGTK